MGYIFCKKDIFGGKITWLCKPLRTERNGTFVPTLNVCFKIAHLCQNCTFCPIFAQPTPHELRLHVVEGYPS